MNPIIEDIRQELNKNIEQRIIDSGSRFFKEEVKMLGVSSAIVGKISKNFFKSIKDYPKQNIFEICEEFWKSGYSEEAYIACNFSYYIHKQYTPDDFELFDCWVNNWVTNWATCDTLCNHSVGTFIEMYPDFIGKLKSWAKSDNRWVKRAAAVTLIIPARKGLFLNDIFEIADTLLTDTDDMVQKGYGWMLKAASESHQNEVFEYVISRKKTMPRTSLRYAIEKMPKELKVKAMKRD